MSTAKVVTICVTILIGSSFFMVGGCSNLMSRLVDTAAVTQQSYKEPHVGLVKIAGPIENSERVVAQLESFRTSESVLGVIVRVNSPGGAVGSSQEINEQIKRLKEAGKPVVASYGDISASGGLYSTLASDMIFANEGTLTGSIGVIFQFPESKKMLDKIGLKFTTIKSGDLKDVGSPFRNSTKGDLKYLQSVINDTYDQFYTEVLENRDIDSVTLTKIADGRVMTGKKAYEVGLIDSVGTYMDALAWLRDTCKLASDSPIEEIKPKRPFIEHLLEEPVASVKEMITRPQSHLMYMMQ